MAASAGRETLGGSSELATVYPTSNIGGVQLQLRLGALWRGAGRRYVIGRGTSSSPGRIPWLRMFTAPTPSRCTVTGASAAGAACHLVEMATVRTHLGRVCFTHLAPWDTVTTEFIFEILFQTQQLQRPDR